MYMNIFEKVNAYVTAKAVAEHYGLSVRKNGMACCPFHNDKHPSMKIDSRYYCFGCGAKGDAIDYVARLYDLSQYDAALKIIADMGLPIKDGKCSVLSPGAISKIAEKKNQQRLEAKFKGWCLSAVNSLCKCRDTIKYIDEQLSTRYQGAVFDIPEISVLYHDKPVVTYMLDILCTGSEEEKMELFIKGRREVSTIVERIDNVRAGFMAGSGGDHRQRNDYC